MNNRLKELVDRSAEVSPAWPEKFKSVAESGKEFGRMMLEECKEMKEGKVMQDDTMQRVGNILEEICGGLNGAIKEAGLSGAEFKLVPMK